MDNKKFTYDQSGKVWIKNSRNFPRHEKIIDQTLILGENLTLVGMMGVHILQNEFEPEHYILTPNLHDMDLKLKKYWRLFCYGGECCKKNKYFEEFKLLNEEDVKSNLIDFQIKSMSKDKYISVYESGGNIKPARK